MKCCYHFGDDSELPKVLRWMMDKINCSELCKRKMIVFNLMKRNNYYPFTFKSCWYDIFGPNVFKTNVLWAKHRWKNWLCYIVLLWKFITLKCRKSWICTSFNETLLWYQITTKFKLRIEQIKGSNALIDTH